MSARSNIGMNGFAQALKRIFQNEKSGHDTYIPKTYGETEDSFFSETNENLRKAFRAIQNSSFLYNY